jgi:hypothetical protein
MSKKREIDEEYTIERKNTKIIPSKVMSILEIKHFLKEQKDMGKRIILAMSGRLQPPTPAHIALIQTLQEIKDEIGGGEIIIMLSPSSPINLKSSEPFEDPLTCEQKKYFVSKILQNIGMEEGITLLCENTGTLQNFACNQLTQYLSNSVNTNNEEIVIGLIMGEDRSFTVDRSGNEKPSLYQHICSYSNVSIQPFFIPRPPKIMNPLTGKEEKNMSGTRVRAMVEDGNIIEFQNVYENFLNKPEIIELFNAIDEGMKEGRINIASRETKTKTKTKKRNPQKGKGLKKRKEKSKEKGKYIISKKVRMIRNKSRKIKKTNHKTRKNKK